MAGTITERGNVKGRVGLKGIRRGVCWVQFWKCWHWDAGWDVEQAEAPASLELSWESRLEERDFGIISWGQLKLGEGMRQSRREKEVADPSELSRGGRVLEGDGVGDGDGDGAAVVGESNPGELASVTTPANSHLFRIFRFFHPFFLFQLLFPVISSSCTGSA